MEGEGARRSRTFNFPGSSKGNVPTYVLDSDKRELLLRTRHTHVQAAAGFRKMRDKVKSTGHEL